MKMKSKKNNRRFKKNLFLIISLLCMANPIYASSPLIEINGDSGMSSSIQIMFIITILSLAPSILIMMTSFTRIIISLHFLKSAIGTQQMPPNQVVIGLALFLTFFTMSPVFNEVNKIAIIPHKQGVISTEEAFAKGIEPMKEFMLKQTRDEDLKLFLDMSNNPEISSAENMKKEIPLNVIVPAYMISELRAGFIIGFLLYVPFIVIDMIVASTLMSMGMMMLPPAMISLPFKILLFILADGWNLLIGQIVRSFN